MAPEILDHRMSSVQPRIRYNTIAGVNGPLVILDDVCSLLPFWSWESIANLVTPGQIPKIQ
jgi:hypothetical protein